MDDVFIFSFFALLFILIIFLICAVVVRKSKKKLCADSYESANGKSFGSSNIIIDNIQKAKGDTAKRNVLKRNNKKSFEHEWLLCTLKGHTGNILDVDCSPNGKYVISCAEDRTCLIWNIKEFSSKDRKFVKVPVNLDHASRIRFSPDSKAFIVSLFNDNTIRIFKIGKKEDGSIGNITSAFDFEKSTSSEIIEIGIATNGKFILTVHADTSLKVWCLRGQLLAQVDTCQMNNNYGAVSFCGRFIASCGFTPDVKVWEILFDRKGAFKEVARAFELKGHTASVLSFSFNNDSSRMVSVSKDGTWRLWATDVQYQHGQDARQLLKIACPSVQQLYVTALDANRLGSSLGDAQRALARLCRIVISPDGHAVALACGYILRLYECDSGNEVACFDGLHLDNIASLTFDVRSQYIISAGGRSVHVFNNVPGLQVALRELTEKLRLAENKASKERLTTQIVDIRCKLNEILGGEVIDTKLKKHQ